MGEHSPEYKARVSSRAWHALRRARIEAADFTCARCRGVFPDYSKFQLHHLTYDRLGAERPEDLEVVCLPCHEKADAERAGRTRARASQRRYEARLDGWAEKVYGEGWSQREDVYDVEERFDRWLEARGES